MQTKPSKIEADLPRLLLLVGMARSGTSWVGKIFDSHPLTLYKHEPDRFLRDVPLAPTLDQAQQLEAPLRSFVSRLPSIDRDHVAGSLPVFAKRYRSWIAQKIHEASVVGANGGAAVGLKLPVLQCTDTRDPRICVVWKSIDSLGRLGVIVRNVPDCRAIVITRHPCGSISSTLRGESKGKFSSSVKLSDDYGIMKHFLDSATRPRGLTLDHMKRIHPVERMAWIWVLANEKAEDEMRQVGRCTSVRYEDICQSPATNIRALFSFAGLPWEEQTNTFILASTLSARPGQFDRLTQNASRYYGVFKDPIQSADKWKTEMTPEHVERVYGVLRQSDLCRLYPETEPAPCVASTA